MRLIDTFLKAKASAELYAVAPGVQPRCIRPFQSMRMGLDPTTGMFASPCCDSWLSPKGVKELRVLLDIEDENCLVHAWKSKTFDKLRVALMRGDYSYCSPSCSSLLNNLDAPLPGDLPITVLEAPRQLDHSIDYSCNLQCPSCRNHIIGEVNPHNIAALKAIFNTRTSRLFLNGTGEFFINRVFLNYFASFTKEVAPSLKEITIITNSNAFTLDKWYALSPDTRDLIKTIAISIDAALPETYHVIRKGGNFFKVIEVIKKLKALLDKGEITGIDVSMVVQRSNHQEIEDFADMFIALGAGTVSYAEVEDWGGGGGGARYRDLTLTPVQRNLAVDAIGRVRAKYVSKGYRIVSNL